MDRRMQEGMGSSGQEERGQSHRMWKGRTVGSKRRNQKTGGRRIKVRDDRIK